MGRRGAEKKIKAEIWIMYGKVSENEVKKVRFGIAKLDEFIVQGCPNSCTFKSKSLLGKSLK